MNAIGVGLGASVRPGLLVLALAACGGKSASLPPVPITGDDAGVAQPEPNDGERGDPDPPAEADASVPEPDPPAPLSSEQQAEAALGGPARTDVVALGVSELLQTYCRGCHSDGTNGEGFAGGFDIGELIARGMIVPGSSATSPLVQNLLHAPPGVAWHPTSGEVVLISQFIDRMRTEPPPSCAPLPFLSVDEAYAAMRADVEARPEAERPFLRYSGVSYASNAGVCGAALDEQRHALFKLVNSVSTASEVHVPAPIDPEQRLYRIDIRDYGWDRALDLEDDGSVDYPDAWSAIVGVAGDPAFELTGPEASALSSATGARVPFLPANALVSTASLYDLYYTLVNIRSNLDATQLDRGIDLVAAFQEGSVRRAGFDGSPSDERMVTRAPLPAASPGDYWLVEVQTEVRGGSIYSEPLDFGFSNWSKSIVRLPNGLMAFSVNGAEAQRLETMPSGCVGTCADPLIEASIACQGCHAGGLLPLRDGVRDYVVDNRRDFDAESFAAVQVIFPSAEELSALIEQDNARYLAALDQAGVPRAAPDPISRVSLQFTTDPIGLERAAAELGVTAPALRERLGELPELASLADPSASIPRSELAAASARALCALGTRNRPVNCP
jgi:hypothetical protein